MDESNELGFEDEDEFDIDDLEDTLDGSDEAF